MTQLLSHSHIPQTTNIALTTDNMVQDNHSKPSDDPTTDDVPGVVQDADGTTGDNDSAEDAYSVANCDSQDDDEDEDAIEYQSHVEICVLDSQLGCSTEEVEVPYIVEE